MWAPPVSNFSFFQGSLLAYGKVVDIGGKPLFTATDAMLNSGDAPIDKKNFLNSVLMKKLYVLF